ncbi:MAG: glycosyltransferase [Pseudobutyrivibrio sp.]|nr:glycosyltransferase [Pseudobutyrivibrio sp.]
MNNKPKTKLLTISLLCCGRPDTTEKCLQSLMPIREAIDCEIQVVDTGCAPDTRAVIEKYADEVLEFTWCNDFAKARNFQLDNANGKMFLYLDDDEWFIDPKNVIDFFKRPDCTMYNIGGYYQRNYLDFAGKEYQDTMVTRMCTVTPETHFFGKIHEYIEPAYGSAFIMDAQVGHFGYVYTSLEDNIKHSDRNIPLLWEMREEDPDNLRWLYQLAQEYKSTFRFEKLYEVAKDGYDQSMRSEDGDDRKYRGNFLAAMGLALFQQKGKEQELLDFCEGAIAHPTVGEYPLATLVFYQANTYFTLHDNEQCKKACNHYLELYKKYDGDKKTEFLEGGLFCDEIFEVTKTNMIYCFLMAIGMEEDDFGPLTHYYRKIGWKAKVVRLNRGFMVMLLKKASEYGYKKEIRDVLNKFFTSAGFRDLMEYQIENLYMDISMEELQRIKEAFKTTDGQKEMDLFIDIRVMEKEFSQITEWDSYEDLTANLKAYSDLIKQWKDVHDNYLDSETGATAPPIESMFSVGIDQFFKLEAEENVAGALKHLKNLFDMRKPMNLAVSELSRLYSARAKVFAIKKNDPEKFAEMYNLEEQLLGQIASLDAAGKTDEAVATYQQLTALMKNTFGVETLHI